MGFEKLKLGRGVDAVVAKALAAVPDADKASVQSLFVRAATLDGNNHLSENAARKVADAFLEKVDASGRIPGPLLEETVVKVADSLVALQKAYNVDGISSHFTFEESLEKKLISELESAVLRARGRPLDINVMIFEFQSDEIGDALVRAAKENPNVTLRVIADSMQASDSSGNELPALLKERLPNVQVKFKKDFPYTWDATLQRPRYSHSASKGLNHHKAFATFIDGVPDRVVMGSFNWSDTADEKNYEDLTVLHHRDSVGRRAITQFHDEFAGYFNNNDACLSPNSYQNFKSIKWSEMIKANSGRTQQPRIRKGDDYPAYTLPQDTRSVDVNGYRTTDSTRLEAIVGATLAKAIATERKNHGRFDSLPELQDRVPSLAQLTDAQRQQLEEGVMFGSGIVSINSATAEELDNCGFTATQAKAIVDRRETQGAFDSVEQLTQLPAITGTHLSKLRGVLSSVDVDVFFNSRPFSADQGGTGYGPAGNRSTPAMNAQGVVERVRASVTVAATDLFNRAQRGTRIDVAMYGMSPSSPEFASLSLAAERGAQVRVVIDDGSGAPQTVAALKALKDRGLDVSVKVQKAKTMHQKFGVVGDDVFSGSANFSVSSSTKHAENRTKILNHSDSKDAFQQRFDGLWRASRDA